MSKIKHGGLVWCWTIRTTAIWNIWHWKG